MSRIVWRLVCAAVLVTSVGAPATWSAAGTGRAPGSGGSGAGGAAPFTFTTPVALPHYPSHEVGGGGISGQVRRGESEPGIKVDSTGTIYADATCCIGPPAATWYSTNGGKSFQFLNSYGGVRENSLGIEGDFVVDDANRAVFADTQIAGVAVTRWRDHGATWERTVEDLNRGNIDDRPWLAWGKGRLWLLLDRAFLFSSPDEGLTWNQMYVSGFGANSLTANRQDGAVWLFDGRTSTVSTDGGATWTTAPVSTGPFNAAISSIATDEAGNGYAVWADTQGDCSNVYLAVSTNHGTSWTKPLKVNAKGCGAMPWVDGGDAGHVVVSWYGYEDTAKTYRVHAAISTDALSASPHLAQATLPEVEVQKGTLDIKVVLDYFQVAVGPDGRFNLVYAAPGPTIVPGGVAGWSWYTSQAGGPLLHANRIAPATTVAVGSARATAGRISVKGMAVFQKPPDRTLFAPSGPAALGGSVARVGPDSSELLLTLLTPPNGTLGFDGLPGNTFDWKFAVNGKNHDLQIDSRNTSTGPAFTLDGKAVGGAIDGYGGRAIVRLALPAVGGGPGSTFVFQPPSSPVFGTGSGVATYIVPKAEVTLTLLRNGAKRASARATLSADTTSFAGTLNVAGFAHGTYSLVTTACYAGACGSATTPVKI